MLQPEKIFLHQFKDSQLKINMSINKINIQLEKIFLHQLKDLQLKINI